MPTYYPKYLNFNLWQANILHLKKIFVLLLVRIVIRFHRWSSINIIFPEIFGVITNMQLSVTCWQSPVVKPVGRKLFGMMMIISILKLLQQNQIQICLIRWGLYIMKLHWFTTSRPELHAHCCDLRWNDYVMSLVKPVKLTIWLAIL